ncbi:MAG: dihydropyrimidine dehydrogenase subunit A [Deltaproteobacteria bacterium]|nr:MAG: dihydropyrimidine dehydrogenase subunit A [Deltaproteobacteria bacterium]
MGVIFSCWSGEVVDNRGRPEEAVPERLKLPEEFRPGVPLRAFMGWDGFCLQDPGVDIVDMCRAWMEAAQENSCGKCFPCRVGTRVIAEILNRICSGRGQVEDLTKMELLGRAIQQSSKCGIGQTAPVPLLLALEHFRDHFLEVIKEGREVPRGRYLVKVTAPCLNACPAHLDIPTYVELIREGRFAESLEVIREGVCLPGTLGRVCVRPCESNCRRLLVDQAVAIRGLKRFVADYEIWKKRKPRLPVPEAKDKKVAVIGAGPAGLACAYYLALRGYQVTVFERIDEPGGMAAVGIPDYRLPRPILRKEVEVITSLGVEIRYNTEVGKDLKFSDLRSQYDALFIGVGAQGSAPMRVEGEDKGYKGFIPGVKYLFAINKGQDPYPEGKTVAVVGGGNVAMDCVRTSFRIGKEDVNLLYRRTRREMPANEEEIVEAEEEGVKFHFLCAPTKIIAEGDRVKAVELIRMELGEPDESGRRRPVPIPGSEFVIETDILIPAIGQRVDLSFLEESDGIAQTRWHTVEADPDTMQTSQPGVFSAGDCVTGPDVLVRAVANGRIAAEMIDRFLSGQEVSPSDDQLMEKLFSQIGVFDPEERIGIPPGWPREESEILPPEVRKRTFEEVDKGYRTDAAIREATRCLRCYRIGLVAL